MKLFKIEKSEWGMLNDARIIVRRQKCWEEDDRFTMTELFLNLTKNIRLDFWILRKIK